MNKNVSRLIFLCCKTCSVTSLMLTSRPTRLPRSATCGSTVTEKNRSSLEIVCNVLSSFRSINSPYCSHMPCSGATSRRPRRLRIMTEESLSFCISTSGWIMSRARTPNPTTSPLSSMIGSPNTTAVLRCLSLPTPRTVELSSIAFLATSSEMIELWKTPESEENIRLPSLSMMSRRSDTCSTSSCPTIWRPTLRIVSAF